MCNIHKNIKYGAWHTYLFYQVTILFLFIHYLTCWPRSDKQYSKILGTGHCFSLCFTHPSLPFSAGKVPFIHQDLCEVCYFQHGIHRLLPSQGSPVSSLLIEGPGGRRQNLKKFLPTSSAFTKMILLLFPLWLRHTSHIPWRCNELSGFKVTVSNIMYSSFPKVKHNEVILLFS